VRFERYIAAHASLDQDLGRERMVRGFLTELRGFQGSAKQKRVLDETGTARASLASLFGTDGAPHRDDITRLLGACKNHSRPVKPKLLGLIGAVHLLTSRRRPPDMPTPIAGQEFQTDRLAQTGGQLRAQSREIR
jgi:hypothetical protein